MPLRQLTSSDLLTDLMPVNGALMAPAWGDIEAQFEENLVDTEDVAHLQDSSMPTFTLIPHLSAAERALLATLTARQQVERRSVESSIAQLPAPGPEQQSRPMPPLAQRPPSTSRSERE
jgi:hypothetical protein